jgi:hypothetical protein
MSVWFDCELPSGADTLLWSSASKTPSLPEHFFTYPFPHFYIKNLLLPDTFRALTQSVRRQLSDYELIRDTDARGMLYGPFMIRSAVEFFCGAPFRQILLTVVGKPVCRPRGSIPQLRINFGPAAELPMHTDSHAPFDFATFFFVHDAWSEKAGGNLQLYAQDFDGKLYQAIEFLPTPNSLVGMVFGATSYHSVSQIKDRSARVALYQEWKFGT